MNHTQSTGLLIGSGGLLGPDVHRMLEKNTLHHRLFIRERKPLHGQLADDRLNVGNLSDAKSVGAALEGIRWIVYIPTNTSDKTIHAKHIAQAAKQAGVKLIVQTSAMLAGEDPPLSFGIEHLAAEREIEDSGVDWITLRPSFFMQSVAMFMQGGPDKPKLVCPVPTGAVALIDTLDIAQCIVECLANPHPYLSKAMTLTGPEALTMTSIADQLSQASKVPVKHVNPPLFIAGLMMRWKEKMDPWLVQRLKQFFVALENNREKTVSTCTSTLLGRDPSTLVDYLNRDEFARRLWAD